MQTRVEQLCDLAANKETTTQQLRAFIAAETIDINERHREFHTAPVDFAVQTGSVQNVRFFVEEMHADLTPRGITTDINLIQWAHDYRSDPGTRSYLTDPENELWKKFNDGTNELHIYAYLGRTAEVLGILEREPDRICDLSNGHYSPLYYANLAIENATQTEIQQLLLDKLQEYKQRHADNKMNLFHFHIGMIFAEAVILKPYPEFDEFLKISIEIIAMHSEMGKQVESTFQIYSKDINDAINKAVDVYNVSEQKSDKEGVLQRIIASDLQRLKALEFEKHKNEDHNSNIITIIIDLLGYYCDICEYYQDRLKIELTAENYNWELIQNIFNNLYDYLDNKSLVDDRLIDMDLDDETLTKRMDMIKLFSEFREFYYEKVEAARKANPILHIKTNPLSDLFKLLENRNTTVEQVGIYLQNNPRDLARIYRFNRVAADQAVIHGNLAIAAKVIESDLSALAIDPGSNRLSLMHIVASLDESVLPEVEAYILDPDRKLWQYFKNGTTDLMAHALAGRVEEVTHQLISDEMRFLETTDYNENVFYWAKHSSSNHEALLESMTSIYASFKNKMAGAGRWDILLKLYKAMRAYFLLHSSSDILATAKRTVAWIEEIKEDNSKGYLELKDYLIIKLADAHLNLDTKEDEALCLENNLSAKALLPKINNETARLELALQIQLEISKTHYRVAFKHQKNANRIAGDWTNDSETIKFKEQLNLALSAFEDATQALADYPNSVKKVGSLRKTYDEFKFEIQNTLDNADEFFKGVYSDQISFESDEYFAKQIEAAEARLKEEAEEEEDEKMPEIPSLSLTGNFSVSTSGLYKRKRSDTDEHPNPKNTPRPGL